MYRPKADNRVSLRTVPRDSDIEGNKKSDELARTCNCTVSSRKAKTELNRGGEGKLGPQNFT